MSQKSYIPIDPSQYNSIQDKIIKSVFFEFDSFERFEYDALIYYDLMLEFFESEYLPYGELKELYFYTPFKMIFSIDPDISDSEIKKVALNEIFKIRKNVEGCFKHDSSYVFPSDRIINIDLTRTKK